MDLQSLPWYGQFLVFLLIGAVAFGLFYFMMYSGTQDQIKNLDMQIEELDRVIRTAEQKERKLPELQAEVKRREAVLKNLKQILPETNEIASIIKRVEGILSASRLKVLKWGAPSQRAYDIYVQHQLNIEVDGTYHNLGIFFDQLSRIKKIFNVTSLSIKPLGKKKNSDYTINANFRASTYTYQEKKAAPKRGRRRK